LVKWDDGRGFGFATCDGIGGDVFVHIGQFPAGAPRPLPGDLLTFAVARDAKRGQRAVDVQFAAGPGRWNQAEVLAASAGLAYFAALGLYGLLYGIHAWLPAGYLVLSILAYGLFWRDKRRAQTGQWRTPEQTLLLISLCGGWPGALLAQWRIHHKNRKTEFQFMFWIVVLINVVETAWYFMPQWALPLVHAFF